MIKNAMEPQCSKWWEFPSIPGYWFTVRSFPDGSNTLLSMQKPHDATQVMDEEEDDYKVVEWDLDFKTYLDGGEGLPQFLTHEQDRIICRHFGLKLDEETSAIDRLIDEFRSYVHFTAKRDKPRDHLDFLAKSLANFSEKKNNRPVDCYICGKALKKFEGISDLETGSNLFCASDKCEAGEATVYDYLNELRLYIERHHSDFDSKNMAGIWEWETKNEENLVWAATPFWEGQKGITLWDTVANRTIVLPWEITGVLQKDMESYIYLIKPYLDAVKAKV